MKHVIIQTLLLISFILLFDSCKKDAVSPNTESTEYFPNRIGNVWQYEVYDSSEYREHPDVPRQYNVHVAVTDIKKLIDGKDAAVWTYKYPWGDELKYFRIENDSIKVYDTLYSRTITNLLYPRELFIQPFLEGQDWAGKLLWTDSFYVKKGIIEPFKNVLLLHRKYIGQQAYYNTDYWFSPGIGFVEIHKDEINQGLRTNEMWTLKSYQLK